MKTAVIFDGDDTLWETMPAYARAKHLFFEEMELLGFNGEEVELQFEQTDLANVEKQGFSPKRFVNSMIETYHKFCKSYEVKTSVPVEAKIRGFGNGVKAGPPRVHPKATHVLGALRSNYMLILATKGDDEVQSLKIRESALGPLFDKTYIVDHKTEQVFERIIGENNLIRQHSWSVGNSLRSDINPALRIGMRAIWIPRYTWDYEEAQAENSQYLFKADSFEDCLEILSDGQEYILVSV